MEYSIEIALYGMINILRFMKIGTAIQALLRFSLRNVRGYNVGTTHGNLPLTPSRWGHVP
jgi:hypothetical protein